MGVSRMMLRMWSSRGKISLTNSKTPHLVGYDQLLIRVLETYTCWASRKSEGPKA